MRRAAAASTAAQLARTLSFLLSHSADDELNRLLYPERPVVVVCERYAVKPLDGGVEPGLMRDLAEDEPRCERGIDALRDDPPLLSVRDEIFEKLVALQ